MSSLLRLYPASWRSRYRDEMEALLEERPPNRHERVDLVRGAIDAWVHPPTPSIIPILAALIGGGLWTIVATAVLVQPVPPDWPGYHAEVLGVNNRGKFHAQGLLTVVSDHVAAGGIHFEKFSIGAKQTHADYSRFECVPKALRRKVQDGAGILPVGDGNGDPGG